MWCGKRCAHKLPCKKKNKAKIARKKNIYVTRIIHLCVHKGVLLYAQMSNVFLFAPPLWRVYHAWPSVLTAAAAAAAPTAAHTRGPTSHPQAITTKSSTQPPSLAALWEAALAFWVHTAWIMPCLFCLLSYREFVPRIVTHPDSDRVSTDATDAVRWMTTGLRAACQAVPASKSSAPTAAALSPAVLSTLTFTLHDTVARKLATQRIDAATSLPAAAAAAARGAVGQLVPHFKPDVHAKWWAVTGGVPCSAAEVWLFVEATALQLRGVDVVTRHWLPWLAALVTLVDAVVTYAPCARYGPHPWRQLHTRLRMLHAVVRCVVASVAAAPPAGADTPPPSMPAVLASLVSDDTWRRLHVHAVPTDPILHGDGSSTPEPAAAVWGAAAACRVRAVWSARNADTRDSAGVAAAHERAWQTAWLACVVAVAHRDARVTVSDPRVTDAQLLRAGACVDTCS